MSCTLLSPNLRELLLKNHRTFQSTGKNFAREQSLLRCLLHKFGFWLEILSVRDLLPGIKRTKSGSVSTRFLGIYKRFQNQRVVV